MFFKNPIWLFYNPRVNCRCFQVCFSLFTAGALIYTPPPLPSFSFLSVHHWWREGWGVFPPPTKFQALISYNGWRIMFVRIDFDTVLTDIFFAIFPHHQKVGFYEKKKLIFLISKTYRQCSYIILRFSQLKIH